MEQKFAYNEKKRGQWVGILNSLKKNAYIIGVCAIISGLLPSFMDGVYALTGMAILGLTSYVVQWVLVGNLSTWLDCMYIKNPAYKGIDRYRKGTKLALASVLFVIITQLIILIVAYVTKSPGFVQILSIICSLTICAMLIVSVILIVMGVFGLAFNNNVDSSISRGMKYIVLSWGVNIVLVIVSFAMLNSIDSVSSYASTMSSLQVISFLSLLNPVLQMIGWRTISKAEYPENTTIIEE